MKKFRPLIIILTTVISIMAIYNKIIDLLANFSHRLVSVNQYIYNWRFGEVSYSKQGTGTPILLIHNPILGGSDFEFQNVLTELTPKHTVYTLDLLGYGRSDKPKLTYTAFIYVQLINDFIKDIIKAPTEIVASGGSSVFVMLLTLLNPKSIRNIILINPESLSTYTESPNKMQRFLKEVIELPLLGTFIYNVLSIRPIIKKQLVNQLSPNYYLKKRQVDGLFESAHVNSSGSKFTYLSQMFHFTKSDIRKALKQSTHSIYLVFGENITDLTHIQEEYLTLNPSIETSTLTNSKNYPHLENPDSFVEICNFFFQ